MKQALVLAKQHLPQHKALLTELDWKERSVVVWTNKEKKNKTSVFTQQPLELGGTFSADCDSLNLP